MKQLMSCLLHCQSASEASRLVERCEITASRLAERCEMHVCGSLCMSVHSVSNNMSNFCQFFYRYCESVFLWWHYNIV